jgi:hypothetical protein
MGLGLVSVSQTAIYLAVGLELLRQDRKQPLLTPDT